MTSPQETRASNTGSGGLIAGIVLVLVTIAVLGMGLLYVAGAIHDDSDQLETPELQG